MGKGLAFLCERMERARKRKGKQYHRSYYSKAVGKEYQVGQRTKNVGKQIKINKMWEEYQVIGNLGYFEHFANVKNSVEFRKKCF